MDHIIEFVRHWYGIIIAAPAVVLLIKYWAPIRSFILSFWNLRKRVETLEKDAEHRAAELALEREKLEYQKFKDSGGQLCPNCQKRMFCKPQGNWRFYECRCGAKFSKLD